MLWLANNLADLTQGCYKVVCTSTNGGRVADAVKSNPDTRQDELDWLRGQVSLLSLTKGGRKFIDKELQVNPNGPGFSADPKHIYDASFRAHISAKLKELPAFGGKKLTRIGKGEGEYLEFVWSGPSRDSSVFVKADEDYEELLKHIRHTEVKKAILIQHWGHSSKNLRNHLLDTTSAEIELYIQNPAKACCAAQRGKIERFINEFLNDAKRSTNPRKEALAKRMKVFLYDEHATVRAVLLDDSMLALGWYVYYPGGEPGREIDIYGYPLPTVYARSDWSGFSELKKVIQFWLTSMENACHQIFPATQSKERGPNGKQAPKVEKDGGKAGNSTKSEGKKKRKGRREGAAAEEPADGAG
jgi:hypothetical protein